MTATAARGLATVLFMCCRLAHLALDTAPQCLQLAEQLGNNPALAPGGTAHAEGAEEERAEWASFLASLLAFSKLERPWTLELTDPLDSSFIAAPAGVEEGQDKRLTRVMYDRPPDENEHFGLAAGGAAAPIA